MKKYDKLKMEYLLFEDKKVDSLESVYAFLDHYHDEMEYSISSSKKAIIENKIDYNIEKIKGIFFDVFDIVNSYDWILEDIEFVKKQIVLAKDFDGYFSRLREQLSDDNFLEISRIAQFTYQKYISNFNYIESIRDSINMSAAGIFYCGIEEKDCDEFKMFFEDMLEDVLIKNNESSKTFVKKNKK